MVQTPIIAASSDGAGADILRPSKGKDQILDFSMEGGDLLRLGRFDDISYEQTGSNGLISSANRSWATQLIGMELESFKSIKLSFFKQTLCTIRSERSPNQLMMNRYLRVRSGYTSPNSSPRPIVTLRSPSTKAGSEVSLATSPPTASIVAVSSAALVAV